MAEITIGELKHRIELQSAAESVGDTGEVTYNWTTYATVYAHVAPISGNERWRREMVGSTVVYRIYIRYRNDVTTKDRVVWGDKTLEIVAVLDLNGDHRWLRLEAVESA